MRLNKFLFLSMILIFASVVTTIFLFHFFHRYSLLYEIPIIVRVGEKVGIDVNNTLLAFGTLPAGMSAERIFEIRANTPQQIYMFATNISFIVLDEETFFLSSQEERLIRVTAAPPPSTPSGEYQGNLLIFGKDIAAENL